MDINVGDILLCKFYFSDLQTSKNRPVLVFKDNLPLMILWGFRLVVKR